MARLRAYGSFQQLQSDLLSQRAGPLTSPIEDIADDMFSSSIDDELDSLWDTAERGDNE